MQLQENQLLRQPLVQQPFYYPNPWQINNNSPAKYQAIVFFLHQRRMSWKLLHENTPLRQNYSNQDSILRWHLIADHQNNKGKRVSRKRKPWIGMWNSAKWKIVPWSPLIARDHFFMSCTMNSLTKAIDNATLKNNA